MIFLISYCPDIANLISLYSVNDCVPMQDYRWVFLYRKVNEYGYFVKNCKFCLNIVRLLENIFPYLS